MSVDENTKKLVDAVVTAALEVGRRPSSWPLEQAQVALDAHLSAGLAERDGLTEKVTMLEKALVAAAEIGNRHRTERDALAVRVNDLIAGRANDDADYSALRAENERLKTIEGFARDFKEANTAFKKAPLRNFDAGALVDEQQRCIAALFAALNP